MNKEIRVMTHDSNETPRTHRDVRVVKTLKAYEPLTVEGMLRANRVSVTEAYKLQLIEKLSHMIALGWVKGTPEEMNGVFWYSLTEIGLREEF